jgi:hypothetical protein
MLYCASAQVGSRKTAILIFTAKDNKGSERRAKKKTQRLLQPQLQPQL